MKNKFKSFILTLLAVMAFFTQNLLASDIDAKAKVEQIFEYEMKQADAKDITEYLLVGLVPFAGTGVEWQAMNLKEAGYELDYDKYNDALNDYIAKNNITKYTDLERIALTKAILGYDKDYIRDVIDKCSDAKDIMSVIYLIRVGIASGYKNNEIIDDAVKRLFDMQLESGGFNLSGNSADVDVTAMALQAVSEYYGEYREQIDKAIELLSAIQTENGGYKSYGVENVESSVQVFLALRALNIDYQTDIRFIKNNNNVLDAIEGFAVGDGSYRHTIDGDANALATTQVLSAYVSLLENGEQLEPEVVDLEDDTVTGKQIKLYIICGILVISFVLVIVGIIRKKYRGVAFVLLVTSVLVGLVCFCKIETKQEHYAKNKSHGNISTTIEIVGYKDLILNKMDIKIQENDTAFDQLIYALSQEQINVDYSGNSRLGTVYIRSIGGLSEFDYGKKSGWTYTVNGKYPNVSCSDYKLSENDTVCWIYTDGGAQ